MPAGKAAHILPHSDSHLSSSDASQGLLHITGVFASRPQPSQENCSWWLQAAPAGIMGLHVPMRTGAAGHYERPEL